EGEILGGTAFEGHAIDGAGEVKGDPVAALGGAVGGRLEDRALAAQDVDGLLHFGVAHLDGVAGDLQGRQVGQLDLGIDLEGGGKRHHAFFDAFHLGFQAGGAGHAQVRVLDDLVQGLADLRVDHV